MALYERQDLLYQSPSLGKARSYTTTMFVYGCGISPKRL
jgi:hypothetical protein